MRLAAILVLSAASFAFGLPRYVVPCSDSLRVRALAWAEREVGVTEATGHNDGERVEFYLRHVGLGKGYPYCAAFVVTAADETRVREPLPIKRTALAYGIFLDAKARGVLSKLGPQRGDILTWHFTNKPQGHTGFVDSVGRGGNITTIEANTSAGAGDQRDGGGVYRRHRNYKHPLGRMPLAGFVGLGR